MAARKFTLYDFFVDLVPGAVALLILFSLLPARYNIINTASQAGFLSGAIFLITSYVLGHLTQAVASPIDRRFTSREPWFAKDAGLPYPFEHQLEQADEEEGTTVRKEVKEGLGDFFDTELSGNELFFATQSYLWNNDIGRMRRFQILYTLFRGLYLLFFAAGILHLIIIVAVKTRVYQSIWSLWELGVLGFILVGLSGIAYRRRVRFHKEMAMAMIFDFYTNVLREE